MFKSICITLCRVFITQQKIIKLLIAQTYLCDIYAILIASAAESIFYFVYVCACVFVCFYYIFDDLQTTPLSEIPY